MSRSFAKVSGSEEPLDVAEVGAVIGVPGGTVAEVASVEGERANSVPDVYVVESPLRSDGAYGSLIAGAVTNKEYWWRSEAKGASGDEMRVTRALICRTVTTHLACERTGRTDTHRLSYTVGDVTCGTHSLTGMVYGVR